MLQRAQTIGSLCVCLAFSGAFAQGAYAQDTPTPNVSDAEFNELIKLIDESQDAVMTLVTGITDEQWNFKQNTDRWSVAECVEHIAITDRSLLEQLKKVVAGPPDPDWYAKTNGKTAMIRELVPNRPAQGKGGVKAVEELVPTGHWDRTRGIEEFYAAHGEVRSFIETMDRGIKDRTMESAIPQFGSLNAYDWLNVLVLHAVRHSRQIAEVQADANYPKKPAAAAAKETDPIVSDEEFAAVVKDLDNGQDTLIGLISGMTDEQWNFKENPDRWSAAECVEHISRTERAILNAIEVTFAGSHNPDWYAQTKGKYEFVRQAVLTRPARGVGSPFRAGGEVLPSEHWDRARGIREFYKSHGEMRAYVETMRRDIKDCTFQNPFPEIGMLNGYDWLTLGALHVLRHSMQVAEIKEAANYPK